MSNSTPASPTDAAAPQPTAGDRTPPHRYSAPFANEIEQRWQQRWEHAQVFCAPNPGDEAFDATRPKFYCLDMFPYPSGAGLHVGHPLGYIATDIVSRYKRLRGFNVLHPMGWDAFGLPAEQYAIQTGVHPAETTRSAIDTFRRQLKRFGFSYDWSREFATIDEDYYCWTQWIWLKAYHAWYDAAEDRARPIDELVGALESGAYVVDADALTPVPADADDEQRRNGARLAWPSLSREKQRAVIDDQRLAYLSTQTVNWCPKLGTALANEEVIDGRSERGGFPVFRKPLRQWMFRITAYAQRLLQDLERLDWPDSTLAMQAEWIGRSDGAEVEFPFAEEMDEHLDPLCVFTTRPDTLFGATFMVVAPEHPLVKHLLSQPAEATDVDALRAYVDAAHHRSDVDRMAETKEKTGVFTGAWAVNPVNDSRIPIWTADYVLMGYGHGAIMAVPGQDQRNWDFARKFDLPIVRTVQPPDDFDGEAYLGEGPAVNSAFLDGLGIVEAKTRMIDWLEEKGIGWRKVNYKLRDWLFSRQRYWGEPFPIVYDDAGDHHAVDVSKLPVVLPPMDDYHPIESDEPAPLLAKSTEWINVSASEAGVSPDPLPPNAPVRREANTMPGWAGSCWYFLRFCDPHNNDRFVDPQVERYWMGAGEATKETSVGGIDLYVGGAEHSVLHLLYARFWHKMLYDLGEVSTPEPFGRLFHQGLLTAYAFKDTTGRLVPVDEVEAREDRWHLKENGDEVEQIVAKMSKALRNVVSPDDIIHDYGADTFRLYEMYMGPLEASKPWNTRDIVGVYRFLQRVWRLVVNEDTGTLVLRDSADEAVERMLNRTIAKVGDDIERLALNTAIAAMIEFVNEANKANGLTADQLRRFAVILSPFAPHIAEELWSKLGNETFVLTAAWPEFDADLLSAAEVELPVQILGKVRGRITVPTDADEQLVRETALGDDRISSLLEGKTVRKVIVVPGKIVNIIAN